MRGTPSESLHGSSNVLASGVSDESTGQRTKEVVDLHEVFVSLEAADHQSSRPTNAGSHGPVDCDIRQAHGLNLPSGIGGPELLQLDSDDIRARRSIPGAPEVGVLHPAEEPGGDIQGGRVQVHEC